jgi:hypothetical protein
MMKWDLHRRDAENAEKPQRREIAEKRILFVSALQMTSPR